MSSENSMFYSTVFFVFRNSLFYNHMDSDCIKVSSYLLGHLKPLTAVVNQKKSDALPFHQRHTEIHQETRSLCSGIQCGQCGWSSAYSSQDSIPVTNTQLKLAALGYIISQSMQIALIKMFVSIRYPS